MDNYERLLSDEEVRLNLRQDYTEKRNLPVGLYNLNTVAEESAKLPRNEVDFMRDCSETWNQHFYAENVRNRESAQGIKLMDNYYRLVVELIEFLKGRGICEDTTKSLLHEISESHGVIAGGIMASFIQNNALDTYDGKDIDIYVQHPRKDDIPILRFLLKFGTYISQNIASCYDDSFFRKNGIATRVTFHLGGDKGIDKGIDIDLMIAEPYREVMDIVTNFDLTCCEVWCDPGLKVVDGTHLEMTRANKSLLRKEYVSTLLLGNYFTCGRISKYAKRGYNISFEEMPKVVDVLSLRNVEKSCKVMSATPDEYVCRRMKDTLLRALKGSERIFSKIYPYFFYSNNVSIVKRYIEEVEDKYGLRKLYDIIHEHSRLSNGHLEIMFCMGHGMKKAGSVGPKGIVGPKDKNSFVSNNGFFTDQGTRKSWVEDMNKFKSKFKKHMASDIYGKTPQIEIVKMENPEIISSLSGCQLILKSSPSISPKIKSVIGLIDEIIAESGKVEYVSLLSFPRVFRVIVKKYETC